MLFGAFVISANIGAAISLTINLMTFASILPVLLVLNLYALWSFRHQRSLNITINAHRLEVRQALFGVSYRIPLVDIIETDTTLRHSWACQLRISLIDDAILIGRGCGAERLEWLARVIWDAAKLAQQRPELRIGTPDEVPTQLAAMRSAEEPAQS